MGIIAAFLGTAFTGVTSLIGIFLARKAAFSLAYIAVFIAIATAFILIIDGLLSGITSSLPTDNMLIGGLSLLPSNTTTCIGIISTAHIAAFAFRFKSKLLNIKVGA